MLILVRHGQTDANARGLLLGRADPPLNETVVARRVPWPRHFHVRLASCPAR